MGRANSKFVTPNNPLQEIQLNDLRKEKKRKEAVKEEARLRKVQAKKQKKLKKKIKKKHKKAVERISNGTDNYSGKVELRKEDFERSVDAKLRKQLADDFCVFILNQTAFTMQFFGNYESEKTLAQEYAMDEENFLTQKLEEHSIILPNALDRAVDRRVQYKPKHGPEKFDIVPLQTQTMYVVFENIDIAKPNEANYDSITPICKVDMETNVISGLKWKSFNPDTMRAVKWKGYARLKLRRTKNEQKTLDERIDFGRRTVVESDKYKEEVYTSVKNPNLGHEDVEVARSSESSAYVSDNEYDYAYIVHLNTHHPLKELSMSNLREKITVDSKVLPDSCVTHVGAFVHDNAKNDADDEEEESEEDGYESAALEECQNDRYLNSKAFMRYFADLLRERLARNLNLGENEFDDATYKGASIHTKNYEIIPAIHVAHNAQNWPDCAFQFKRRERPVSVNPLTGQRFQWPTQTMIKRIESFGFHVIPQGYAPKVRKNPFREIEWKIVFPKAERYLEMNLTNTQVKVFMIAKALIKTFVEPQQKDSTNMFTIDHLRTHLFWECERNYGAWPEEFLGEVLLKFLKSFMQCLRRIHLPDFFIQERNLFESIPESSLSRLHNIIAEIAANPVMHLLLAYRNLHQWEEFLPKLNYKKIYTSIVEDDYLILKSLSKNTRNAGSEVKTDGQPTETFHTLDEEDGASKGLIASYQEKEKTKGTFRRRTLKLKENIERRRKLENERTRVSVDSIDLEFIFSKSMSGADKKKDTNWGVENLRRTNVLETFIANFIQTAEKAIPLRSIPLAKIYLNHARRLCSIYSDYGCDTNAIEFISRIEGIESDIEILRKTEKDIPPPALPMRTSIEPARSHLQSRNATKSSIYGRQNSKPKIDSDDNVKRKPSVRFKEDVAEIEPRSFTVDVEVHKPTTVLEIDNSAVRKIEPPKPQPQSNPTVSISPASEKQDIERNRPHTVGLHPTQDGMNRPSDASDVSQDLPKTFEAKRAAINNMFLRNMEKNMYGDSTDL